MNSRRLVSVRTLSRQHLSGSNEYFDGADTDTKTIAAMHSQCPLWVISGQTTHCHNRPNVRYCPKADKMLRCVRLLKVKICYRHNNSAPSTRSRSHRKWRHGNSERRAGFHPDTGAKCHGVSDCKGARTVRRGRVVYYRRNGFQLAWDWTRLIKLQFEQDVSVRTEVRGNTHRPG